DEAEYREVVAQVKAFLEGRVGEVIARMEADMRAAAARQDFELAATYRDRLEAVKRVTGYDSSVVHTEADDLDFLGVAKAGDFAMVQLFQMRGGRVVGRDKRFLQNAEGATDEEILEAFMADYYGRAMQVPPLVLVPAGDLDLEVWNEYLTARAGRKVAVRVPQRGDKVDLME